MINHKINPLQFANSKRDPATLDDLETVFRQLMENPATPEEKSQNREPTQAELRERWKLKRSD